ncbi:MAG: Coagulation factor 5/8 type domain-containing protein [Solirubrobacteraceae bacterium]
MKPARHLVAFALLAAFGGSGLAAAPASALKKNARYALAGGCYDLRSSATGRTVAAAAGPFRLKATALGSYLIYGKHRDFLSAGEDGSVAPAPEPSEQGDWRVDVRGRAFTLTLPSGKALTADRSGKLSVAEAPGAFSFRRARGCAAYPESAADVTGRPSRGASPFGQVQGLLETHLHWMAFESFGGNAHCGRPWHPYGVAYAMVDCPDHEPGGSGLVYENVLSGNNPGDTHDTVGWPTFKDWPHRTSLTHEGTYFKWVERAWRGGLRVLVNLNVDNAGLCELWPTKRHNCDEMDTVRLQIKQLNALQDYVDAQYGGPGRGWLRVVKDPFQARRVINAGKLAVINGIEISRLFDCRAVNDVAQCDEATIDRQLDEAQAAGVVNLQPAVKADNALSGAAGDPGTNGVVTNNGNRQETGHYFDMRTCEGVPDGSFDKTQISIGPGAEPLAALTQGQTPTYPPPPHCNTRGLTALGAHLVTRMMDKGMILDPDHMSASGRRAALDLLEARQYSGVISSHSWSTPDAEKRIYHLGGVITPKTAAIAMSSDSSWFISEWKRLRKLRDPRFLFGIGFGSDMNGVAKQPSPRADAREVQPVTYPFKSLDGKQTIGQHVSGKRKWDFNVDGVAQYGLYLDWIQELRTRTNDAITPDLARGAEAYLQMWERAGGVPARRSQPARAAFARRGLGVLRLGVSSEALLRAAGQPAVRGPFAWRYGVTGGGGARVAVVLNAQGRPVLIASTAPGHTADGAGPGTRTSALRGTRALGPGLRVRRAGGGARYVYGTRGGRVRFVAVTAGAATRTPARLRAALRRVGLR